MTYVVTENCVRCKYMDCVEVCPVDCFRVSDFMLVIDPQECIDCAVCEPECPANAIHSGDEPGMERWVAFATEHAGEWPAITAKAEPPPDADAWNGVEGKFEAVFGSPR